jgi:hypothetical protein
MRPVAPPLSFLFWMLADRGPDFSLKMTVERSISAGKDCPKNG